LVFDIILNAKVWRDFKVKLENHTRYFYSLYGGLSLVPREDLGSIVEKEVCKLVGCESLNFNIEQFKSSDKKDCDNS
jgi:CRISPR/Cas system-associated protein Cas5 (RAMP superfamily)